VPDEIRRYCPVEISASGVQVLQWEKDSVEEAGLVKIDILGNRSLAVIRDTLDLVEMNYGKRIDYTSWNPVNDPKTIAVFYQGSTFGVFYFESPATRQVLKKVSSRVLAFDEYVNLVPFPSQRVGHFHHQAGLKTRVSEHGYPGFMVNTGIYSIPFYDLF